MSQRPAFSEEPQIQEPHEQSGTAEDQLPLRRSGNAKLEPQEGSIVASPESLLGFSGTVTQQLLLHRRCGVDFFKQLLSRFSSEQE